MPAVAIARDQLQPGEPEAAPPPSIGAIRRYRCRAARGVLESDDAKGLVLVSAEHMRTEVQDGTIVGRRERYYRHGGEQLNALLMRRDLS